MAGLLDTICSLSRAELEGRKKIVPFGEIFEKASEKKNIPLPFSKSILEKSGKNGISVIAELKRSSPSEGLIRENFVPDKIALSLEKSGAAALSVLTEKKFFGGNIEVLEKVSGTVKIPTLRKDFIFDEYQLCEARLAGA